MKIIKQGSSRPPPIRFECRGCKTIFEAERTLEARHVHDQRDGDYWQCACPTCQRLCTKQA